MKKIILSVLFIGILSVLGGCKAQKKEAQADVIDLGAQPKSQIVEAYGVIKASDVRDVSIGFNVSIDRITVKNGQKVTSGDTLMVLDTQDYEVQLKGQECDLAILKGQENMSREQEDKAAYLEENLALQKGRLKTANLNRSEVISDMENGVVYNIGNAAGDMVYAGSRLLSIADLDTLVISANIDQQFISWVSEGAKADIIPEYDKNSVIHGTVSFISAKAFPVNGETVIPVEISLEEGTQKLIPDGDVQVKIYPAK
jgi:multidrug resistance efflux pump